MSTFVTISTSHKDKQQIEDGFRIMKDVEYSLSSYKKSTPIYKLNKYKKAKIDNYTFEALQLSKKIYEISNGYFDITIGSITKDLYRFGEDERVPSKKELSDAVVNFNGINFDENKASLDDGVKVDLGGMGKGFGIDKVAEYFRKNSISDARISASGDIRCLGFCSIEIQNPFKGDFLASFKTTKKDLGITTSGNYNRYVESTKNNHLINPKSKESQTKFISITLIGEISSAELDAYATAVSVMPINKAYALLESLGVAYIVLQSDRELKVSSNISKYTKDLLINYAVKK